MYLRLFDAMSAGIAARHRFPVLSGIFIHCLVMAGVGELQNLTNHEGTAWECQEGEICAWLEVQFLRECTIGKCILGKIMQAASACISAPGLENVRVYGCACVVCENERIGVDR